jgi:hypothetical protein
MMTDRGSTWGADLLGSLAVLDRRILSIDYSAGVQKAGVLADMSETTSRSSTVSTNYGLSVSVLPGGALPLRVFANRSAAGSKSSTAIPGSETGNQSSSGTHSSFGGDVEFGVARLARIQASGSVDSDDQVRNFLFGQNQSTRQRRATIRAFDVRPRFGYDVSYRYDDVKLDIPMADLSSRTTQEMLTATTRLVPSPKWQFTLGGRASRLRLGREGSDRGLEGVGMDASARITPRDRLFASVQFSYSSNLAEAVISGKARAEGAEVGGGGNAAAGLTRLASLDFDGRAGYSSEKATLEIITRSVSFGIPVGEAPMLTERRTVGTVGRWQTTLFGVQLSTSADGEVGTAWSNQGQSEPYRSGGAQASMTGQVARLARLSVNASARQANRLTFYVSQLASRTAGGRIETLLPAWARMTAAASWSSNRRDATSSDSKDEFLSWSLGLAGSKYSVVFDANQTDAHALLISPEVIGRRVDLVILTDRQPDLLRNLLGSFERSRQLSIRIQAFRSLQVQGFLRRESRTARGLFTQDSESQQVAVVYGIREVQLEAGWNRYMTASSLAAGRLDVQRFYVRIRRDVSFF